MNRRAPEMVSGETAKDEAAPDETPEEIPSSKASAGTRDVPGSSGATTGDVPPPDGPDEPDEPDASEPSGDAEAESEARVRERVEAGRRIIRRRANWAMAGGLLPLPVFDVLFIAGVQLTMLRELSAQYGVPFKRNLAKKLVMTLLGSVLPLAAGASVAGSLMKFVPLLGLGAGLAAVSALAAAATHATGAVFLQHFESGGTFLDFDPIATRDYFKREFEISRERAQDASP